MKQVSMAQLIAEAKAKGIEVTGVPEPRVLSTKISEKGGVQVSGLGRFPLTLYRSQWERLFEYLGVDASKVNPAFRAVLLKARYKGDDAVAV